MAQGDTSTITVTIRVDRNGFSYEETARVPFEHRTEIHGAAQDAVQDALQVLCKTVDRCEAQDQAIADLRRLGLSVPEALVERWPDDELAEVQEWVSSGAPMGDNQVPPVIARSVGERGPGRAPVADAHTIQEGGE